MPVMKSLKRGSVCLAGALVVAAWAGCTRQKPGRCDASQPCEEPNTWCDLAPFPEPGICRPFLDAGLAIDADVSDASDEARLEVLPASQDFGPVVEGGTSVAVRFTVTNRGSGTSASPVASLGLAPDFTIESNDCVAPLPGGAACSIDVRFTPKAPAGAKAATLTVSGSPGGSAASTLSGTALMPGALRVTPMQQALGAVEIGAVSADFPFMLTNTGGSASGVPALTLLDTGSFTLARGNCTASIAPGASCTFSVRFNPTAVGDKITSVMISAQPGGDSAVSLSGTGSAALTVMKAGGGSGVVTSVPAGINCGATCVFAFRATQVTITAAADPGAEFVTWSGAGCAGSAPCMITMDAAKTVTATFETRLDPPRLVAPLSTATATSRRPILRWELAPGTNGAHVEICASRACTAPITSFDVTGTSGAPAMDLPRGVVFWRLFPRMGSRTGTMASPTWQVTIGTRSAAVNTSWGTTLDANGDGLADVLLGASGVNGSAGRAYLHPGGVSGISQTASPVLTGPDTAQAYFGESVASAGDVNGDGFGDALVGARGVGGLAGRAYLYLGSAAGLSAVPATITGPDVPNGSFGTSVSGAGDVNGDGFGDIVVGADIVGGSGRAYLYSGSASGLSPNPATITGPDVPGGGFGAAVAGAGDINGDGFGDIVVGAYGVNSTAGRAYLYLGSGSGLVVPPATITGPDVASGAFGRAVEGVGDINGDGFGDVLVGAYGMNGYAGRAYVYTGGASGLSSSSLPLTGPDVANSYFGESASAGDVNGDGFSDVVVGASGASELNENAGRAYLYRGSAAGFAAPIITIRGPDVANAYFGVSASSDVNGDTFADVVVGALGVSGRAGRVYSYLGGALGLSAAFGTITGPDVADGRFGVAAASGW